MATPLFHTHQYLINKLGLEVKLNRSDTKPGGALLQLPCELGHEDYNHCLNKPLPIFWSYHDQEHYDKQINPRLALLRISTAVNSDFKQFLHPGQL